MDLNQTKLRVSDVPTNSARRVSIGNRCIAVYNLNGEFFATDDTCTHARASLSEGQISGDEIICPLHFATFNIKTGQCTGGPAIDDLRSYPVLQMGDEIQITL
jgi:nitrite reductase/ring-hydroxylating ferredoxin subunit